MKKFFILFGLLFLIILTVNISSDDRELFMGLELDSLALVKPNCVVLMDSSGSMNTIIFYPKWGVDKKPNTADDGFNPKAEYTGTLASNMDWDNVFDYTSSFSHYRVDETIWLGAVYNSAADTVTRITQGSDCISWDAVSKRIMTGDTGWANWDAGWKIFDLETGATAEIASKVEAASGGPYFVLTNVKGDFSIGRNEDFEGLMGASPGSDMRVIKLYGTVDMGNVVRYPSKYVLWMYKYATEAQREAVSFFSDYGTFEITDPPPILELSRCATPGNDDLANPNPRIKQTFTRIQVAREVICEIATRSNEIVNLGLFKFDSNSQGADKMDGVTPSNDVASDLVAYKNMVWGIEGNSWTPLAEALADVWLYYRPGPPGSKPYWPCTSANIQANDTSEAIEHWCQQNFVVVMTDGESTQDNFSHHSSSSIFRKPVKRTSADGWKEDVNWDWSQHGWGDLDDNEASSGRPSGYNDSDPNVYCPFESCWAPGSYGSDYLDDVAYFMTHQDLFPDDVFGTDPETGWPGDQVVSTYTIGFNADNDMLDDAALNGSGTYYTATDYESLITAFEKIFTSIILRSYAFSSITAPKKSSSASSDDLTVSYIGFFMPDTTEAFWDGHLVAFELIDSWGWDKNSDQIYVDNEFPYASLADCQAGEGVNADECRRYLRLSPSLLWDAADEMLHHYTNAPRNLWTRATQMYWYDANDNDMLDSGETTYKNKGQCVSDNNATSHLCKDFDDEYMLEFNTANSPILQQFMGTADVSETNEVINKISEPHLSDIFHSDVLFVGPPPYGLKYMPNINPLDPDGETYVDFYEARKGREPVLYSGTNDGVFHAFSAYADPTLDGGKELWGFIPDTLLPKLKLLVLGDGVDPPEYEFMVDGYVKAGNIITVWIFPM